MKTATVREIRNEFSKLAVWVGEGQKVEIRKRGKPIAWLIPIPKESKKKFVMPDFEARRKEIWGDRVFSATEVKAMRDAELEGQLG